MLQTLAQILVNIEKYIHIHILYNVANPFVRKGDSDFVFNCKTNQKKRDAKFNFFKLSAVWQMMTPELVLFYY